MAAELRLPLDELVRLRVRRGIVQGIVRDAYLATVASQDREHRQPREFTEAWRANLASALESADVDLSGSGPEALTADDTDLAWKLYEAASRGREEALGHVRLKHSQLPRMGSLKSADLRGHGHERRRGTRGSQVRDLLPVRRRPTAKDQLRPGLAVLRAGPAILNELEALHPSLTWYTTAQLKDARGFYERYRQNSSSPWTDRQHPCLHFD